jgi:hypothetical protein
LRFEVDGAPLRPVTPAVGALGVMDASPERAAKRGPGSSKLGPSRKSTFGPFDVDRELSHGILSM